MASPPPSTGKLIQAGLLTWLVPGLGHWLLGQRGLGAVFFLAISIPYFVGLAVGGLKNSINPWSNRWLFLAELGIGGYTSVGLLANSRIGELDLHTVAAASDPTVLRERPLSPHTKELLSRYVSYSPESDVATIYLATAGLLNLLAILDALTRAQTGGLPTFYREQAPAPAGQRV
jgi:hypothetical protein